MYCIGLYCYALDADSSEEIEIDKEQEKAATVRNGLKNEIELEALALLTRNCCKNY